MSDCMYCGNMVDGWLRQCAGCGSPRSANPLDTEDRAFAKIGRTVVARDPDGVIAWLERHQPKTDESTERCWVRRGAKAFVGIGLLFAFPHLLFLALGVGIIFSFYTASPEKAEFDGLTFCRRAIQL